VADVEDETSYLPALEGAGYMLRVREPTHRMLRTPERDVHVHVCGAGGDWEQRHLRLRDHLRESATDRCLYEVTKRGLARQEWATVNDYAEAKSGVIEEILSRAGLSFSSDRSA
jgi:GrpB-like predicted nucleotidyltransferase (UPF0157 family)